MIMNRCFVIATLLAVFSPALAQAADDWWFDVEVIIFDRDKSIDELKEQFVSPSTLSPVAADLNLIDQYLRPDISFLKQGLAVCGKPQNPLWMALPTLEEITTQYQQWQLLQSSSTADTDTPYSDTPRTVDPMNLATNMQPQVEDPELAHSSIQAVSNDNSSELETVETMPSVLAQDIASYWVAFSGIDDIEPVTVPPLKFCDPDTPWMQLEPVTRQWRITSPDNSLPAPSHIPEFLDGRDWPRASHAHLLPYDALELTDLSRQIRQTRGLNRLLHIAWRQPVKFGEDNAYAMRISAGDNFAEAFDVNGMPLATNDELPPAMRSDRDTLDKNNEPTQGKDDFFAQLDAALADAAPLSFREITENSDDNTDGDTSLARVTEQNSLAIWQLDGYLKVYLKYINRVPYLHIDSEMQYRSPSKQHEYSENRVETVLKSVPFKQKRRVISKQIHYFDHPLFGLVVEIRRHQRPPAN